LAGRHPPRLHLLLRVPDREGFLARFEGGGGEERLLEHLKLLYSKAFIKDLRWQINELRQRGLEAEVQELLGRFKSFSAGVAIGSREFIEEVFRERRECFGAKRKDGARPIREAETGLFAMRSLRRQAVE